MKNITNYRLTVLLLSFFFVMSVTAANAQTGTTYGCYIASPPHILTSPGDVRIVSSPSDCVVGETAISWEVFPVGTSPAAVTFDGANIWVSNQSANTITKLRAIDGANLGTFSAGPNPGKSVFDGENIWITNYTSNTLTKLRASDGALIATIPFRGNPSPYGIAFDGTYIWVSCFSDNSLSKLRLSDGAELSNTPGVTRPVEILIEGSNIWITNNLAGGTMTKINKSTGAILDIFSINGGFPGNVAFDGSNIWTLNSGTRTISKIRSSDSADIGGFPMGIDPAGIAFDGTNMWVANQDVVLKYRASDGALLGSFPGSFNGGGGYETGIAFDGTYVWVSNRTTNTVTRYRDEALIQSQPDGLVAWYKADGNANDSVGGHNPSATSGLSFVNGKFGQGFSFASGGYIDIPDSPNLENQQFTISAWVRPDGAGPNNDTFGSTFIQKCIQAPQCDNGGSMGMWWSAQDNRFRFSVTTNSNAIASTNVFPSGQFYHVTGTYDGAYLRLYVNGHLEAESALATTIPYNISVPWTIGSSFSYYRANGYPRTFNGVIDDLKIYNRALNSSEVSQLCSNIIIAGFDAARGGNFSLQYGSQLNQARTLLAQNFPDVELKSISTLTSSNLSGVNVLLISSAVGNTTAITPLSSAEQTALRSFVESGGSVFLLPDNSAFNPSAPTANNSLIAPFGMEISGYAPNLVPVTVIDPSASELTNGSFGTVASFDQFHSGMLTNLGTYATAIANNPYGTALAVIPPDALNAGSGKVVISSDVDIIGDNITLPASNQILFLNTIDYLLDDVRCEPPDTFAPSTTATTNPVANAAGWNNSDVSVLLSSTDNEGGSGVKEIIYSASGAQTITPTTVNGANANLTITAEGETVITYFARDNAGNSEAVQTLTVKIDKTAPSISCGAADGAWHSADVSIACTAEENISALANSADANFNLTTNVPADTETSNAATDSREVCDVAGNCATADSISGNKIDKKAPVITIISPTAANYLLNQAVTVDYTCTDGGSGVADCTGTTPNGGGLDTSSTGTKTFTVNSADNVGNTASPTTINYTVGFGIQVLFDQTKAHKSGSTVPVKIRLVDANGMNVSSASTVVHAVSVVQLSNQASTNLDDAGNSNPDFDFRYDESLGGYIFNLKTTGYSTGTFQLNFTVGNSPTIYSVLFQVRQ